MSGLLNGTSELVGAPSSELDRIAAGEHHDPHSVLGAHPARDADGQDVVVIRGWRPDAVDMAIVLDGGNGERIAMRPLHPAGIFGGVVAGTRIPDYRLEVTYPGDNVVTVDDPYRFWPTMGELDLHLLGEGRHEGLLAAPRRARPRASGGQRHVVRGLGAERAIGAGGRRLQQLGRPHEPDADAGRIGCLGDLPARRGRRRELQVRGAHRSRAISASAPTRSRSPPRCRRPRPAWCTTPSYIWRDAGWLADREAADAMTSPMSIYEVHLGSWRMVEDGDGGWRSMTYRELADTLPAYVGDLGFTHVELLPVAEHPFGGSWGYQVTGYYAPTARFGSPDDFRYLVDRLHQAGIGVIVDWVAAHFPKDDWALARFDGTALYEHVDPRLSEHPDWGTLVFNYGRHEVRNFLLANALYWIEEYHIDGLRVDAVASMLYLDYSRSHDQWVPNRFGGKENLEAIDFIRETNEVVYRHHPSALLVAEESTSWPAVSRPTYLGGLGFGFKWNMGWMNDSLEYFSKDPVHRRYHHHELTFSLLYAFHENFILPLSHDEVSHGKGSLVGKMPGDKWQQHANLRTLLAWMWAHPGRQLLFMGGEIAQSAEWRSEGSIDWHLLEYPEHAGTQKLVRQLNAIYRAEPALWEQDFDWTGFRWIDPNDADNSVLSFLRLAPSGTGRPIACVANLTPLIRHDFRIGLPEGGRWTEILNSDAVEYAGSNVLLGEVTAEDMPWHDLPHSASISLPPLGVVWLAHDPQKAAG